jgi:hypothetical protein
MKLNLFTHGRVVLANRLGNGGLGRTVSDACFDDPPFLGRKMCDFFIGIHEKPSFLEGIARDPNYIEVQDLFPCPQNWILM